MRTLNRIVEIFAFVLLWGVCGSTPAIEVQFDFCFRQADCQAGFECRFPSICSRPGYGTCVGTCQPLDFCPVVDPSGPCEDGCCGEGAVCVGGNCFGGPPVESTDHFCPVVDPIGACVNGCCPEGAVCVDGNCFGIPR